MISDFSRRSFLKAGAFASAPLILPFGSLRAANGGDVPNVGVIGCGIQGRGVMNNFLSQACRVVAVCDVDKVRREDGVKRVEARYAKDHPYGKPGQCKAYADFREVIARKDIDIVLVATPDHWHAYITIAALNAGKDVYCEKPLTYSIEEAWKLWQTSQKTGRIVQTGAMQRSGTEFYSAAMLARNGAIGEIKYVDCNFGGPSRPHRDYENPKNAEKEGAPNPDCDFDMWCGGAPLVKYSDRLAPRGVHGFFPMFWRFDDYFGTGYCGDWGAHHLDIAQWGLGLDNSGPEKIIKSTAAIPVDPFLGGRRQHGMQFVFPGGVTMRHNPFSHWGTVFYGTNGIIAVNRGRFRMWVGRDFSQPDDEIRKLIVPGGSRRETQLEKKFEGLKRYNISKKLLNELIPDPKVKLYRTGGNHVADLISCFHSRKQPCSCAEVGARASVICGLCNISYVKDASFDWDAAKFKFKGGTGNDAWLRREGGYRRGFEV